MAEQSSLTRPSRGRLGLTQKLVALIVLTTGAIVLFLGTYFPDQQIRASHLSLEKKAGTYGRLVSQQVASAIAFDDVATAREVFDSVGKDEDVASLTLLKANGEPLHTLGKPGPWVSTAKGVSEQRVVSLDEYIVVVSPVVSLEGPRGTLVIELSTKNLQAEKARITRTAVLAGGLALVAGAVLAFLIARSLGRRVGAIAVVASKVADGDLNQQPAAVSGSDEIAVLGGAFNAMLRQIQTLVSQITKSAQEEQERLEGLVSARTRQLDRRNEDLRLVLDNVGQGFLSVAVDGTMSEERSAIVNQWFGEPPPGASFFDYMDRRFPGKGVNFRLGFDNMREEWMPVELGIDQLPKQLDTADKNFGFAYRPISVDGRLEKLLVVVSDVTAVIQSQRAEEEEREMVQVMRWMMSDRSGFMNFLSEAEELVHNIFAEECDRVVRMRLVHTLKGNAAIFGFTSISRLCHALEDHMVECGSDLTLEERQRVRSTWTRLREKMAPFVDGRKNDALDISRKEYMRIVQAVSARTRHSMIGSLLHTWELEPAEDRFLRMADYAQGLAERLGKGPIDTRIESNEVRLDGNEWSPFWQAFVHVVRNAIDHGLETEEERLANGKPATGVLILRSQIADGHLTIEAEDRGRGIDWDKVAEAARARGLATSNQHDLELALFHDSLSTRDKASDTSGRGVGLSAVREVCLQTGGQISIKSVRGRGTTFRFEWRVDDKGRRIVAEHLIVAQQERTG